MSCRSAQAPGIRHYSLGYGPSYQDRAKGQQGRYEEHPNFPETAQALWVQDLGFRSQGSRAALLLVLVGLVIC